MRDQFGVPAVHAVKYPDGEHASAPIRRDLVLATPALHDRKPTAHGGRPGARFTGGLWPAADPGTPCTRPPDTWRSTSGNAGGTVAGPRELARAYRTIGLKLYADH
ncbi:hypothetical protein MRGA423_17275 [Mycobacterium tuberculosis RGTB423]|nr:hypothetical protein MRGA423_17275 [Mycobacterium tuberculosis RGTB423]